MNRTPSTRTVRPANVGSLRVQSWFIRARYSRVRRARSANDIPTASNSSSSPPIPTPKMKRPPESTSRLATAFAVANALRSGTTKIPVASRIRLGTAAGYASATERGWTGVAGGPGATHARLCAHLRGRVRARYAPTRLPGHFTGASVAAILVGSRDLDRPAFETE